MTDEQLVDRHLAGDSEAFERLAARYQDRLYRLAHRMLGNRDDALDAVQEVLLRLLRSLPSYRGQARFSTWLYRLAANTIVDCRRRRRDPAAAGLLPEPGRAAAGPGQDPDHACEAEFRHYLLNQALRELPDEQRLLLILRDREGLSNAQVADILGIDVGTLKARLHRARGALRRVVERGVAVAGQERHGRYRLTPEGAVV